MAIYGKRMIKASLDLDTTSVKKEMISVWKISNTVGKKEKAQENGFYVECGGYDSETASNTLFFEKTRHWNGLLLEADPHRFKILQAKHRKALLVNACLNTEPYPTKKTFYMGNLRSRVAESKEQQQWIRNQRIRSSRVTVLCLPLYSILRAIGQLNIDFFSLDIEGDELPVSKTVPWNKSTSA